MVINVNQTLETVVKNGTAKLKKDRSSAITASIPLSVSEWIFFCTYWTSFHLHRQKITAFQLCKGGCNKGS